MENKEPVLFIFSGLAGSGKSTLAQNISKILNAVYLRIDTIDNVLIEQCKFNLQGGESYNLAKKIIEDNLKIGNSIISDQCNPWNMTRLEFNNVAIKNNCKYMNIEIICSDKEEHKKRIENRGYPKWEEINKWGYEQWNEEHIIIDTANKTIEECTKELLEKINNEKNRICNK
jgi:adenylate kinase family enzyme